MYATLQAMAPTNIKTVHQTSLLHIESSLDLLGLLSPAHVQRSQQQSGQIALQPGLFNKSKFLKATSILIAEYGTTSYDRHSFLLVRSAEQFLFSLPPLAGRERPSSRASARSFLTLSRLNPVLTHELLSFLPFSVTASIYTDY